MNTKRKAIRFLQICILLVLGVLLVALARNRLNEQGIQTLSRLGSTGSEVRQIQTRLKSWGYYTGTVDGVYGAGTRAAVIAFQRKNGLTADGVAGSATLRAIGLPAGSSGGYGQYSQSDYQLLARVISAESRGEPFVGQVAVGAVILNRVDSPLFPNTIAGVVYQPGAFTCLTDGQFNQPVAESAFRAAQNAINGWDPSNGSLYYYNPDTAISQWIRSRPILLRIGKHVFCK
ncbi:spore cortex-lytic enzyme [Ethanoligenens harbinense]|uniref:Spore cortex-lytic enzyme n=1 Tax=Ethanoligenens harbinense (strain DSM 18485 / JCM 12961 / CGMCC 1.5033 / YUAN-3) TaxID=663278 RepID=E6U8M0_ETHHY|nr:spore cortex-lytic enzyme [Ethanoligenens harbinense]ADU26011.1 spore cortex-lytic enzyme [Ethanoligenens harbinense YUAN-3]AVQ95158.1 spore cortex-lytic enzyme [Ethanoligenens harbinense YUAN-3]AYF37848.1 spore cortex-lytic enzyme [Ethanoligenens harbinense]AYF40571.1 spore cortex-lytic enzyme [Ethanoligenens harbinense]QCN91404.1 spore cortex-lytic enzyme [Ethanoligenens harbinense]